MGTKEKKPARESGQRPEQRLKRAMLVDLYEARQFLTLDTIKETGLRMPVQVYFYDPAVAETTAVAGIDNDFTMPWEPGLGDGPTSARFAVVDYDAATNVLAPPAIWDRKRNCYVAPDRTPICRTPSSISRRSCPWLAESVTSTCWS